MDTFVKLFSGQSNASEASDSFGVVPTSIVYDTNDGARAANLWRAFYRVAADTTGAMAISDPAIRLLG